MGKRLSFGVEGEGEWEHPEERDVQRDEKRGGWWVFLTDQELQDRGLGDLIFPREVRKQAPLAISDRETGEEHAVGKDS